MTSPSHSPRSLGDHLHVLPLGLGCMGMSEFYGASDDRDATRLIHEALERGVSLFDSADTYGQGHNEQLLGKALHGRRDSAVIATKFGIVRRPGDYAGRSTRAQSMFALPVRLLSHALGLTRLTSTTPTVSIPRCRSKRPSAPCPS